MPSFSNLKIRTKLILIVAVPLLGLLYFSISSTLEKSGITREMGKLESLVGLSVKIGNLAHELQKERGMTAGFLGSQGVKFASELPAQRGETDKKAAELKQALANFEAGLFDLSLKNSLDEVTRDMSEIGAKRTAVTAQAIPAPDAIGYYTRTIGKFLNIPTQTSTLSSNSQVARLASAYSALLLAKERAGQERAILTGVFAADKFTPELFARFLSNASAQDVYTKVFDTYALNDQKEFYKSKVSGQAVDEVAAIKKNAVEKVNEKSLGTDSGQWFKAATERINLLKEVEGKLSGDLLKTTEQIREQAQAMMVFYIVISLAALLTTIIFAMYMIRIMLRQLGGEPDYAAEAVHKIAGGDLSIDLAIKAGDNSSLLYSLKTMQDSLRGLIGEVKSAVGNITTGAGEIADGNTDLSQRTEEQAASLEETAASMEELTATVKQNAENARQANQLAKGASEIASKGGAVVGQVVGTMSSINESSRKIVDIISVIDGIAFQTNILALNAAVEAARAGELGRGFAVVAAEVRNLAQRSAAAAKEIKTLISNSVEKVEDGTKQVDAAGKTMEEIVNAVKRVTDIMADISAASAEQSTGIEQVNQAIIQMDEVTQQNAALVEEAATAAKSLEEEAQHLAKSVSVFKLDSSAGSARPTARRATAAHPAARPAAKQAARLAAVPAKRLTATKQMIQEKSVTGASIKAEIESAVAAHSAWKTRLHDAIDKGILEIPIATIKADNQCAFGKWLYSPSITQSNRSKEYQAVKGAHAEFHGVAAKVAELAQAGNKTEANTLMGLGGEFSRISSKLHQALMDWDETLA